MPLRRLSQLQEAADLLAMLGHGTQYEREMRLLVGDSE